MIEIVLLFLFSFKSYAKDCKTSSLVWEYRPRYAKNFTIKTYSEFKIVESNNQKYLLSTKDNGCEFDGIQIHVPVSKVAATSTTHLSAISLLQKENTLKAFQGVQYISSKNFNKKLVNLNFKINPEIVIKHGFELVIAYEDNLLSSNQLEEFKKLKLPLVLNFDYKEKSALARAEWLIFISSFYNLEDFAVKEFKKIETSYLREKISSKVKVLVGDIQNGKWITCGGKSDFAQLVLDAGGELVLPNNSSETVEYPLEKLAMMNIRADIWLPQNNFKSKKDIDSRYKIIKYKHVFNNNNKLNKFGSNDFWEEGVQRPDLMLKDLKSVFGLSKNKLIWYHEL